MVLLCNQPTEDKAGKSLPAKCLPGATWAMKCPEKVEIDKIFKVVADTPGTKDGSLHMKTQQLYKAEAKAKGCSIKTNVDWWTIPSGLEGKVPKFEKKDETVWNFTIIGERKFSAGGNAWGWNQETPESGPFRHFVAALLVNETD